MAVARSRVHSAIVVVLDEGCRKGALAKSSRHPSSLLSGRSV